MANDQPKSTTIKEDLERHPELTPLIDMNAQGQVVCFGWVSPVYELPTEILEKFRGKS
jgi:hypothetical protein